MSDGFGPIINSTISLLHKTIKEQIEATDRQSNVMTKLTYAAVVLAIVQTGAAIVQVWLALRCSP